MTGWVDQFISDSKEELKQLRTEEEKKEFYKKRATYVLHHVADELVNEADELVKEANDLKRG